MIRLMVNADDFGWDENRTKAILEAYRQGIVTTTTAMVNMPWFEKAIEMAKGTDLFPNIGLHLCLTEGFPLTKTIRGSRLFCREDGSFHGRFHVSRLRRMILPSFECRAVAEEVEAQMKRYMDAGLPLMHLDSHHHSHTDLSIARIVLPIARRFGFRSIRLSRNLGSGMTFVKRLYKWHVNHFMGKMVPFNVDYFGAFGDLVSSRGSLPDGSKIEIMTHPLYRDASTGELSMSGVFMDYKSPIDAMAEFWKKNRDVFQLTGMSET